MVHTVKPVPDVDPYGTSPAGVDQARIDPQWFRQVLGRYPTGVCVITANDPESGLAGMVVGSFTSVSLDPPLVAFLPDRSSTSWPKIERAGAFCVNILGFDQEEVCRRFSSKAPNKFIGQFHRPGATGSPILDKVVAWIDCDLLSVTEAGDHFFVLGSVRDLQLESPRLPLLFFEGGYGRFSPSSLTAPDPSGMLREHIREVDLMRIELESLASDLGCRATCSARVDDEVIIVAQAGQGQPDAGRGTLVGQRFPFVPPTGTIWTAWSDGEDVEPWLRTAGGTEAIERNRLALLTVRERGYSLGLMSPGQRTFAAFLDQAAVDPNTAEPAEMLAIVQNLVYDPEELTDEARNAVRQVSVPVFDANSRVAMALTIFDFNRPSGDIDSLHRTHPRRGGGLDPETRRNYAGTLSIQHLRLELLRTAFS